MLEFCPLCMKNGRKEKVRVFQLNLEEAVWACGAPDCVWPIGYEDLTFFRNVVVPNKEDRGEASFSTNDVPSNTEEKSSSGENVCSNNMSPLTSGKNIFPERMFTTETNSPEANVPSHTKETGVSKETSNSVEETSFSSTENTFIPMELSLYYTPPVTPVGGEFKDVNISILSPESVPNLTEDGPDKVPHLTEVKPNKKMSEDESISSVQKQSKRSFNHLSISGLLEVESGISKRNKSIEKEESERTDRALPKITNIERTNIDLKIERYDKTVQKSTKHQEYAEQLFTNTLVTEVAKDYNILTDYKWCNEINLDGQWKENKNKSVSNQMTQRLQSSNMEIVMKTNSCMEMPAAQPVINTCMNLDTSNYSTLNSSSNDLNFEEILGDISPPSDDNTEDIDSNWLEFLES